MYSIQDNDTGCVYVGSTKLTLEERMKVHLVDLRRHERNVTGESTQRIRYLSVFPILEANNYTERVIEVYDAKDDTDVLQREGYWQRVYKEKYGGLLLNKRIEGKEILTGEELKTYERENKRKWRRKKYVKEVLNDIIDTIVQHHTQLIGDYSEGLWV